MDLSTLEVWDGHLARTGAELVADCWNANYTGAPDDGSPWLSGDCDSVIVRGGAWLGGPKLVASARRFSLSATYRSSRHGFRVARSLPPE